MRGLKGPLSCLNEARFGIIWGVVGAARACLEEALAYTGEREQFGKPLASFQLTQRKLALMAVAVNNASLLAWRLGALKDAGTLTPIQVSYGKYANVRAALDVAREARTTLGGAGITLDHTIMRHMNNLETVMTYEGTEEMHLLSIGAELTGIRAFDETHRASSEFQDEVIALVTGASKGIGAACALALSKAGHRVALVSRDEEALQAVAATLPGESLVVPADMLDPAAIDAAFARVEEEWGPVEILVVNAGAAMSAPLVRTSDEDWQRMLDLNLTAPFRCLRRALPAMTSAGVGRVVVIASIAGKAGSPGSRRTPRASTACSDSFARRHPRSPERRDRERRLSRVRRHPHDRPVRRGHRHRHRPFSGRGPGDPGRHAAHRPAGDGRRGRGDRDAVRRQRRHQRPGHQRRRWERAELMADLVRVNPPSLAKPSGFSHAVIARGTTIHLAGQTGMDAHGAIVPGGVVAQFEQALANVLTALVRPAAPPTAWRR